MSTLRRLGAGLGRGPAAALAVFLLTLLVYAPTVAKDAVSTDTAVSSWTSWQIAQTGQPWMEGLDLREDEQPITYFRENPDGHTITTRSPGPIWAATPFYLGADGDLEDIDYRRSGLAVALLAAGAVTFLFLALRPAMGTRAAGGVAAVAALTTPMWSVSADALWTHSVTTFGIAGAAWAASRNRWWLAGAFLGVGLLGRLHVALIAAILGLGLAWTRRSPAIAVRVGITSALGLVPLLLWNRHVFGAWDLRSGYGHTVETVVPGLQGATEGGLAGLADAATDYLANTAGFLVSPDRGLVLWTPLLVLLAPAVVRSWRGLPDWSRWLALGGVGYTAVQLEMNHFAGGDAFYGYRLALELLICLVPAYALSLPRTGHVARALAPVVVGVQLAAVSLGAVFEALFLPFEEVWTDNSFVHALVNAPAIVVPWTLAAVASGVLATRWLTTSADDPGEGTPVAPGHPAPQEHSLP